MLRHKLSFILVLILTWPIRWLSYPAIHRLGAFLGTCAYWVIPKFRKRALSNLSLASTLKLSEKEIPRVAIASLQNLMITCLEYAKFSSENKIGRVATCVNPSTADQLMKESKPVIFFCGHQSNWEVLFLEGTSRMPGLAIGRPIKNAALYHWILSIRQKYGGKMITPQNAVREGFRGLKKGAFLGIVGDQGMPDSGYHSLFFGRKAWTSPIAAILSYRTGSPIIVATTQRKNGRYFIHYSEPIWPDATQPMEQEIDRLMKMALAHLENTIKKDPGQWLWAHNRWKQQTPDKLKRKFRHESMLIILPSEKKALESLLPGLMAFREIYPHEFVTIYAPQGFVNCIHRGIQNLANGNVSASDLQQAQLLELRIPQKSDESLFCERSRGTCKHITNGASCKCEDADEASGQIPNPSVYIADAEVVHYVEEQQLLKNDYRFKLIFNFSHSTKIKRHFKKLAAFEVVTLKQLRKMAKASEETPFAEVLKKALLKNAP